MLQKLNERIQGVVAWLIIILIAITFTLFGVDYYLQSHQNSDVKIVINDQPISNQAFEVDYRRTRSQRDPSQITAHIEKQLQKNVLNQIITNTVTVQSARKYGFEVNAAQANSAIVSIRQFQEDGHFSSERYKQALSSALYTPETFQNEVRQGMLLNQQRFAFVGSAFALPGEVKRFVRLFMQHRSFDYLSIPASLFVKQVKINNEAIKNYYEKHQNKFKTAEKVSLEYVQLSMKDVKSKINISDAEVKQYYDDNENNYLTPAQWQVSHILFALPANATETQIDATKNKAQDAYLQLKKNPSKFSQILKAMTADKLSIASDGKLPWLVAGQTEFDKALVGLTKPNQISQPVKTKQGFEVFKLLAYKPASKKPFSEVKATIKAQLLAEKSQAKYARALEELSDLSYQTPDSLKPVAEALKLPVQSTQPFSRKGGDRPLTQNKALISAAYSHDVLELENNSEPVQIDNDSVVVLRVKEHFKQTQKSLASVKKEIENKLIKQAAMTEASKLGELLIKSSQSEQKTLLAKYNLNWHQVKDESRDGDKADALITALAFNLSKPGAMGGRKLPNGQYVLVNLQSIQDGKLSALDKEHQKSIAQQIEANYGMMAYDLYVNSLISKAKIERH